MLANSPPSRYRALRDSFAVRIPITTCPHSERSTRKFLSIFAATYAEYGSLATPSSAAYRCRVVVDNRARHCVGGVVDTTRNTDRESSTAERSTRKVAPPAQEPKWRAARPDRRITPDTQPTLVLSTERLPTR